MARKIRNCVCCGTEYRYCPDCWDDRLKPIWMVEFCSEECKTIWETASRLNMNMINKEDAKAKLSSITLKPREEYAECVQRDLKNILGEETKPVKAAKAKTHEVV